MKHLLLLSAGFAFLQTASASPICTTGTLATYEALGAGGCTIGSNTLASFATVSGINGATEISPALVSIVPGGGSTNPSLTIMVSETATAPSLDEAIFTYMISGPGYTMETITLSGSSETVDGATSDTQNNCAGGSFGPNGVSGCTGSAGTLLTLDGIQNTDMTTFAKPTVLSITDDFVLDGGTGGSATGGAFEDQFTATATVPEPITYLLTFAGLALTGLLKFRSIRRNP